jgi:hypothetical protein
MRPSASPEGHEPRIRVPRDRDCEERTNVNSRSRCANSGRSGRAESSHECLSPLEWAWARPGPSEAVPTTPRVSWLQAAPMRVRRRPILPLLLSWRSVGRDQPPSGVVHDAGRVPSAAAREGRRRRQGSPRDARRSRLADHCERAGTPRAEGWCRRSPPEVDPRAAISDRASRARPRDSAGLGSRFADGTRHDDIRRNTPPGHKEDGPHGTSGRDCSCPPPPLCADDQPVCGAGAGLERIAACWPDRTLVQARRSTRD